MAHTAGTWSAETARSMVARANAARKLRGITGGRPRKQRTAETAITPSILPLPADITPADTPSLDFEGLSLSRVRAHLHNLHQVISTEETKKRPDAQRLHWLCKSLAELSELERRLAGRPLPGSRRPAPEPSPGRMQRTIAPPAARPAPRAIEPPPSPAADELDDDDPPLQSAPLD